MFNLKVIFKKTEIGLTSGILKTIQIYEHYDGANKEQIKQHRVTRQTVLYSDQRNWKQKVLRRKQRELQKLSDYESLPEYI